MRQISNPTAVAVRPAAAAPGTPGWATFGSPGVTPATILDADTFNSMQQELMNVLAAAGETPDATNDAQLLAAIKAMGGNWAGLRVVAVPYMIQASDAGHLLLASGAGTVTFPVNVMPAGGTIGILPPSTGSLTLATAAPAFAYGGSGVSTINLGNNESAVLTSQGGTSDWIVVSGALKSSPDFAFGTDYQFFPSGKAVMKGSGTAVTGGDVTVTFPQAFPAGSTPRVIPVVSSGGAGYAFGVNTITLTTFNVSAYNGGVRQGAAFDYIAFG